jgi:hypothetical protein
MNISDKGNVCIDILKQNWSPALSLFKVMLSLSSLLTDPNPRKSHYFYFSILILSLYLLYLLWTYMLSSYASTSTDHCSLFLDDPLGKVPHHPAYVLLF